MEVIGKMGPVNFQSWRPYYEMSLCESAYVLGCSLNKIIILLL